MGIVCVSSRGRRLGWRCGRVSGGCWGVSGGGCWGVGGDLGLVCDEAMAACLADRRGTNETVLREVISSSADGF